MNLLALSVEGLMFNLNVVSEYKDNYFQSIVINNEN